MRLALARRWQGLDEAAAEIGAALTDQIEQACLRALVRHVSRRAQIYPEPGSPGEAAWWERAYRHLSLWSGWPLQPERRDSRIEGPDFAPPRSRPQHAVELSWLDAWALNVCAAAWRCGPCILPWPADRPDVADVAKLPEWPRWSREILDAMLRFGSGGP